MFSCMVRMCSAIAFCRRQNDVMAQKIARGLDIDRDLGIRGELFQLADRRDEIANRGACHGAHPYGAAPAVAQRLQLGRHALQLTQHHPRAPGNHGACLCRLHSLRLAQEQWGADHTFDFRQHPRGSRLGHRRGLGRQLQLAMGGDLLDQPELHRLQGQGASGHFAYQM